MIRIGSIVAAALGVAVLATPALPVTIANTQWSTSGRSVAVVKGLGKAKNDAELLLTFFTGGDARGVDAERVDRGLEDLGHGGAHADVVEADVDVAALTLGVEAVVLDHGNTGLARQVDDGGAGRYGRVLPNVHDLSAAHHDHGTVDQLTGARDPVRGGQHVVYLRRVGGHE